VPSPPFWPSIEGRAPGWQNPAQNVCRSALLLSNVSACSCVLVLPEIADGAEGMCVDTSRLSARRPVGCWLYLGVSVHSAQVPRHHRCPWCTGRASGWARVRCVKWPDAEGEEAVRQETVASNLLNMNKHACGNATKEGSQRSSLAGSQRSSLASGPMDDPGVEPPSAFSRAACHR
jgi:hypothetical protein